MNYLFFKLIKIKHHINSLKQCLSLIEVYSVYSTVCEISDILPFGTAVSLASAIPMYRVDKPSKAPNSIPALARGLAPSSVGKNKEKICYIFQ